MRKFGVLLSTLVVGGGLALTSGFDASASGKSNEHKPKITTGEYNYDTGEFRMYVEHVKGLDFQEESNVEDSIGVLDHDPNAGGGIWTHGFIGVPSYAHFSNYDHKVLHHRSSVSNSNETKRGPWRTPTGGTSYIDIERTATGNKANWQTSNIPGMEP